MPQILTARTSTQNAAGLLGTLRLFGRRPNLILRIIGGYQPGADPNEGSIVGNGWTPTVQSRFPLTVDYDLPAPSQAARLEGAVAPDAITYVPDQDENVVQLFHETVDVTFLAASERGRMSDDGVLSQGSGDGFEYSGIPQRQLGLQLSKVARDFNYSALRGTYARPANPGTDTLQMRGILPALTTNVLDANGAVLAATHLEQLYERMIINSGVQPESGLVAIVAPLQLRALNAAYATDFRQGDDRMVGGLMTRTYYTPFGVIGVPTQGAYELDMPNDELLLVNPDPLRGRYLPVEGESIIVEPLAVTGSARRWQVYGQLSIDYGAEWLHGKITGLATPPSYYT